tara:strand:- start:360 stop:623 length:264 start_codon:yes stop_codon:yes gene_type:complete
MKTTEETKVIRKQLLNQLEDIIKKRRSENKDLLNRIGLLESAETSTFKNFIRQIENNNITIAKNIAQFQILKDQFIFGFEGEQWWKS